MARLIYDAKLGVYAGYHFDVESSAVEDRRRQAVRDLYQIAPEAASPSQLRLAAAWAEDEDNWHEGMAGVIPLHRCGEEHGRTAR